MVIVMVKGDGDGEETLARVLIVSIRNSGRNTYKIHLSIMFHNHNHGHISHLHEIIML